MDKHHIRKVIGILVLFTIFMCCLTVINIEISAEKIDTKLVRVNKTASDNGITFTIGDAVKEGHERISLEYVIETEQNINIQNDDIFGKPEIYINGKWINQSMNWNVEKIGENKYKGLIHINPEYELPNNYDVKFGFYQILNQSGRWEIEFSFK
ncbi:hypothetical protein [Metabacillus bambusae]|uniref:DUF4352 domain-containing protein n=1 Tax=Metabacillus bambusae TaxID=2795218 RepID=A0ABS3N9P1_9BACI|nr:hypothetical protein [Metabacillus bambusae]MBO1514903.1 hypothetical protein [Metabacillus bambusae]